mmetsp:Transcript_76656/g.159484  ORF Transcript_76656/g.159484 Transcript_76656/m.159484 type:complete len:236 (-) Transcript_76656:214-921(-)
MHQEQRFADSVQSIEHVGLLHLLGKRPDIRGALGRARDHRRISVACTTQWACSRTCSSRWRCIGLGRVSLLHNQLHFEGLGFFHRERGWYQVLVLICEVASLVGHPPVVHEAIQCDASSEAVARFTHRAQRHVATVGAPKDSRPRGMNRSFQPGMSVLKIVQTCEDVSKVSLDGPLRADVSHRESVPKAKSTPKKRHQNSIAGPQEVPHGISHCVCCKSERAMHSYGWSSVCKHQ